MTAAAEAIRVVVQILMSVSLLLTLAHLIRVSTGIGRIVALEVIAAIVVGSAALITILSGQVTAIDVALAVALVSFTGTVAFAAFFEGWHADD
ncbi:MAG: monovalent cation/H+ antiporter complex subunit F [Dehalococcoidia bacterium]